jgi:hypothetical protein
MARWPASAGRRANAAARLVPPAGLCATSTALRTSAKGPQLADHSVPEGDEPHPIADAARRGGQQSRGVRRELGLRAASAREAHRRRDVEQEDQGLVPLLPEALDEGLAGAGGGVPVEVADVVPRHVGARLVELHPGAAEGRRVASGGEPRRDAPRPHPQHAGGTGEVVVGGCGGCQRFRASPRPRARRRPRPRASRRRPRPRR